MYQSYLLRGHTLSNLLYNLVGLYDLLDSVWAGCTTGFGWLVWLERIKAVLILRGRGQIFYNLFDSVWACCTTSQL